MELFIGPVPEGTTTSDLLDLLYESVHHHLFPRMADLVMHRISIDPGTRLRVVRRGQSRKFGYVKMNDPGMGQFFLEALNGERIRGVPVNAREFKRRALQKDRRAVHWRIKNWRGEERRVSERRTLF